MKPLREIPLHFRCILQRGDFGALPRVGFGGAAAAVTPTLPSPIEGEGLRSPRRAQADMRRLRLLQGAGAAILTNILSGERPCGSRTLCMNS